MINGVETVWEYNGCKYHGCLCIKNPTDKQLEKQQKWIERKAHLEANGCHVIEMSCCKWKKMLKYIRRNPPKTEYGRILCFDNQECFIFWTSVHFEQNGQVFILSIFKQEMNNCPFCPFSNEMLNCKRILYCKESRMTKFLASSVVTSLHRML